MLSLPLSATTLKSSSLRQRSLFPAEHLLEGLKSSQSWQLSANSTMLSFLSTYIVFAAYAYVFMYIQVCIYVCVYVYIHTHTHTRISTSLEIFKNTSLISSNTSSTFPSFPKEDRNCFLQSWEQGQSRTRGQQLWLRGKPFYLSLQWVEMNRNHCLPPKIKSLPTEWNAKNQVRESPSLYLSHRLPPSVPHPKPTLRPEALGIHSFCGLVPQCLCTSCQILPSSSPPWAVCLLLTPSTAPD